MWCFRIAAFAAVLFNGWIVCRVTAMVVDFGGVFVITPPAIHDGTTTPTVVSARSSPSSSSTTSPHLVSSPSPSPPVLSSSSLPLPSSPIFVTSPLPQYSSSTTQIKPQASTSSLESLTTMTTTPTAATLSTTRLAETATPPPTTQPTPINVAQIAGIAIGSSAVFGLVATIFFFVGRRNACSIHSNRRISRHNVATNLASLKTKFGKFWAGGSEQGAHLSREATTPAELTATTEAQEAPLPPQRPVNNLPYFYHPVTVTSCVAGELEDSSTASYNPLASSRQQDQQDQQDEILPVELPTSPDPGNSPLPRYEEPNTAERYRAFSWAAPESAYRPDKFEPDNKI